MKIEDVANDAEKLASLAWKTKQEMIKEVFLCAVAEGWPKFYFWIERSAPGDAALFTMNCGPVEPEGVEHEVYDVAAIEAAIDNQRGSRANKCIAFDGKASP